MKTSKTVVSGLIGISVSFFSCSNALSQNGGWQPAVAELRAQIEQLKTQVDEIPCLEKRVEALEKLVAQNQVDIAANQASIVQLQEEIETLKKLIADLANAPKSNLACVTGMFIGGSMSTPDITNQKNISINDPSEVFTIYDDPGYGDHQWGLICNEDWVNTGCSQRNDGKIHTTNDDVDVKASDNGYFSDNDEYGELFLYTTCCKINNQQQQAGLRISE